MGGVNGGDGKKEWDEVGWRRSECGSECGREGMRFNNILYYYVIYYLGYLISKSVY